MACAYVAKISADVAEDIARDGGYVEGPGPESSCGRSAIDIMDSACKRLQGYPGVRVSS